MALADPVVRGGRLQIPAQVHLEIITRLADESKAGVECLSAGS
jgi:hypothetical protein